MQALDVHHIIHALAAAPCNPHPPAGRKPQRKSPGWAGTSERDPTPPMMPSTTIPRSQKRPCQVIPCPPASGATAFSSSHCCNGLPIVKVSQNTSPRTAARMINPPNRVSSPSDPAARSDQLSHPRLPDCRPNNPSKSIHTAGSHRQEGIVMRPSGFDGLHPTPQVGARIA